MHGFIVTWSPPSECTREAARAALAGVGASVDLADEVTSSSAALRRAAVETAHKIKGVAGRVNGRTWQVSNTVRIGHAIEYARDSVASVDGAGVDLKILDHGQTAGLLAQEFQHARATMVAGEISGVVVKLFKRSPMWFDLVPLRDRGGVYFVPAFASDLLEAARGFVEGVGGTFRSYRVEWMPGDQTEKAVAESVAEHLRAIVDEFRQNMLEAAQGKRAASALARRVERARELRGQIEAYEALLGGLSASLKAQVASVEAEAAAAAAAALRGDNVAPSEAAA